VLQHIINFCAVSLYLQQSTTTRAKHASHK